MINSLKTWAARTFYRLSNRWVWRKQASDIQWRSLQIPSGAGSIQGRIYQTDSEADKPLIVFFHGGGWVIGDLETHHPFCLELSAKSGCRVISVDYRRAPEHPFPAAPDDCLAAVRWIAAHGEDLGWTSGRLVLAGDSAGGNLAVCTALELEELRPIVDGVIAIYPVADHYSAGFNSYVEHAKGQLLTRDLVHWFWDSYLDGAAPESSQVQRAMPLRSTELGLMPKTLVVTAERDPLRDEGIALAEKLRSRNVATRHHHYPSSHGFACSEGLSDDHLALMREIVDWLGEAS